MSKSYIEDFGLVKSNFNGKLIDAITKIQPTLDHFPYKSPSLYNDKLWRLLDADIIIHLGVVPMSF